MTRDEQRPFFSLSAFFGAIFGLYCLLGAVGHPWVHPYFDYVGIRETGTALSFYASQPEPVATILYRAMTHVEGPVQFFLLNAYSCAVGDLLPLDPLTMQFPNTVFAFIATIFVYLLGAKLHSQRMGYCSALAFALMPWLGVTLRAPWYFNTVSCVLHVTILYSFLGLMIDPAALRYRIAAPACLAVYLFTGLDWPSFLFSLGLFVLLGGKLGLVLRNPYNVMPVVAGLIQVMWPLGLYLNGRTELLHHALLVYPFVRYGDLAQNPDFTARVVKHVLSGWGPQVVLAMAGLVLYAVRVRGSEFTDRARCSLLDATAVWFLGASFGIVSSSTSVTYLYVVGIPTALLAGLAMMKLRQAVVVALAVAMVSFQGYVVIDQRVSAEAQEDRRILAAACFLIEQRPDLLSADKTAFLPRNTAACIGQYARGQNRRIVMPKNFPAERRKHSIGSDESVLLAFVDAYEKEGRIAADWLILDSELFSKELRSRGFYERLRNDPNVRWIARFTGDESHETVIGVVSPGNGSLFADAPQMETLGLARAYREKYDRISFLKRNIGFIDVY